MGGIKELLFYGDPPYLVWAEWRQWGGDVQVLIGGGTHPHIGAVALAYPHEGKIAVQCVERPHHREGKLAERIAMRLAEHLQTAVSVAIGIHIDDASPEEIRRLVQNAEGLTERLLHSFVQKEPPPITSEIPSTNRST